MKRLFIFLFLILLISWTVKISVDVIKHAQHDAQIRQEKIASTEG